MDMNVDIANKAIVIGYITLVTSMVYNDGL